MSDDKVASMKIAQLVLKLVRDKRTNPAAPQQPVPMAPQPAQG